MNPWYDPSAYAPPAMIHRADTAIQRWMASGDVVDDPAGIVRRADGGVICRVPVPIHVERKRTDWPESKPSRPYRSWDMGWVQRMSAVNRALREPK